MGKDRSNYKIGLSCGFAEYNGKHKVTASELIGMTDEGMYVGKRGRSKSISVV